MTEKQIDRYVYHIEPDAFFYKKGEKWDPDEYSMTVYGGYGWH